ncbi:heme exporter protein CcmB [Mucilaginibacter myungsuensis]|uniref:Heme exporter protein CcmB n=1 Tax=Mucilaginibacter myungsuensis TaxID=649104 RepID=A0A929PVE8_9SPHI|nr:heme exporter protein CcmB [Mucilaginibacter myungsuensis]MBE9660936.1 heme exporter protein CcmB [Mucilaginibacter myungsuensis]MDN3600982.1 heme exporter protein CcmB [Mucilaginibacter myungsuensis]
MLKQTLTLLQKEILIEWRSKYAFNSVLLYVVSTVFVCYIAFSLSPGFQQSAGYPIVWNVLFWVIMLFAAVNAIAKSFLTESRGRMLYYYSITDARAVILSKTIYNGLLMLILSTLTLIIYSLFFTNTLGNPGLYFLAVFLGSVSFSTVFTMVSAIASKAGNGSGLMAVLSFPVIIPVILTLIKLSKNAMDGIDAISTNQYIILLVAINFIVVATSLILFPFLWRD